MASYGSFAELKLHESEGIDYRIRFRYGRSGIAVMAIHGGGIEPGTTEIAEAVAGDLHTFYTFSGRKRSGNALLHIASSRFDEPRGIQIAEQARTVITIHGCRGAQAVTYVGGRHPGLMALIKGALIAAGFTALDAVRFPGINPKNICNLNRSGMGVQLEISLAMRRRLFDDIMRLHRKRHTPRFADYVRAIQNGIHNAE